MGQWSSKSKNSSKIGTMKEPKKNPQNITIKLFKNCEMWENLVLFFFFANLILIWVFVTFYFLLGYIQFDFSS
jgi:hypothetical protein